MQYTMLQNAVYLTMESRQVKLQTAQFKTHTGIDLSYNECCSLLLTAAQQYNVLIGNNGPKMVKKKSLQAQKFGFAHHDD